MIDKIIKALVPVTNATNSIMQCVLIDPTQPEFKTFLSPEAGWIRHPTETEPQRFYSLDER
jgi:hypothetical protein